MGILLHEAFPLLNKIKHSLLKRCIQLHQCPVLQMHVMENIRRDKLEFGSPCRETEMGNQGTSGFAGGMTDLSPVPLE